MFEYKKCVKHKQIWLNFDTSQLDVCIIHCVYSRMSDFMQLEWRTCAIENYLIN